MHPPSWSVLCFGLYSSVLVSPGLWPQELQRVTRSDHWCKLMGEIQAAFFTSPFSSHTRQDHRLLKNRKVQRVVVMVLCAEEPDVCVEERAWALKSGIRYSLRQDEPRDCPEVCPYVH